MNLLLIESYKFGEMIIAGQVYTRDLIILSSVIKDNWWRIKGHELAVADIRDVIDKEQPEILIVGTGKSGMMKVLSETKTYLDTSGIALIAEKTDKACDIFNQYRLSKKVVGAFHLTC